MRRPPASAPVTSAPLASVSLAAAPLAAALLLSVSAVSLPASAADVAATSRIDAVTVFPSGAEVKRLAKVKIPAGEQTLVFADLPATALPGSIRVEGKATGALQIGSVDTRRLVVPRADAAASEPERKRLEDEMEKLKDQKSALEAQKQAVETQRQLIGNLANLPSRPAPAQGAEKAEDWGAVLAAIATGSASAARLAVETSAQLREVERQILELQKKINAVAPLRDERTEVKVNVAAGAAVDADLVVRYQVPSASWTPAYDARLAIGDKAVTGKLTLVRRAGVVNHSGEDWQDIALHLSTTRPGSATTPGKLETLSVDYAPPPPAPAPVASRAMPASAPPYAVGAAQDSAEANDGIVRKSKSMAKEERREISEAVAAADASAFQTVFDIPGRHTIARSGEPRRVQVDQTDIDTPLLVRVVPRRELTAYLLAKLELPATATPLLPGQVSLFRDGVFVGNGALPQLAPGETHELGFGADDRVKVKRIVTDNKKGESGILTTSSNEDRSFLIKVQNLHTQAMQMQVIDRVPVSQQQDIKVDVTSRVTPTKKDFDDRRGVYVWEFQAAPAEEKQIVFGYRVTWPADKQVRYRELSPDEQANMGVMTK